MQRIYEILILAVGNMLYPAARHQLSQRDPVQKIIDLM